MREFRTHQGRYRRMQARSAGKKRRDGRITTGHRGHECSAGPKNTVYRKYTPVNFNPNEWEIRECYVFAPASWLPSAEYCLVIWGVELTMFPSPSICKK